MRSPGPLGMNVQGLLDGRRAHERSVAMLLTKPLCAPPLFTWLLYIWQASKGIKRACTRPLQVQCKMQGLAYPGLLASAKNVSSSPTPLLCCPNLPCPVSQCTSTGPHYTPMMCSCPKFLPCAVLSCTVSHHAFTGPHSASGGSRQ